MRHVRRRKLKKTNRADTEERRRKVEKPVVQDIRTGGTHWEFLSSATLETSADFKLRFVEMKGNAKTNIYKKVEMVSRGISPRKGVKYTFPFQERLPSIPGGQCAGFCHL